jgi:hypothetical protein
VLCENAPTIMSTTITEAHDVHEALALVLVVILVGLVMSADAVTLGVRRKIDV